MDIDFIIQDTFALIRPQWKLAANLDEAGRAFAELVKQNYKSQEQEKALEAEEPDEGTSSDDEADDDELPVPDMDAQSSSDEPEAEVRYYRWHLPLFFTNRCSRLLQTMVQSTSLILKRTSLLRVKKRNVIQKLKPNSIGSLQKCCLRA